MSPCRQPCVAQRVVEAARREGGEVAVVRRRARVEERDFARLALLGGGRQRLAERGDAVHGFERVALLSLFFALSHSLFHFLPFSSYVTLICILS